MGRKHLERAKQVKNDEFYTSLADVKKEIKNYRDHFAGKVVYLPCDDYRWSNFYLYFKKNFEKLKLKSLIVSHFQFTPVFEVKKPHFWVEYDGHQLKKTPIKYNGDFRSVECTELLERSDVVVTNPPFSLLREFVAWLYKYKKDFLIIGPQLFFTNPRILERYQNGELFVNNTDKHEFYNSISKKMEHINIFWFNNFQPIKNKKIKKMITVYRPDFYKRNADGHVIVERSKHFPVDYEAPFYVPFSTYFMLNPDDYQVLGSIQEGQKISLYCEGLRERDNSFIKSITPDLEEGKPVYKYKTMEFNIFFPKIRIVKKSRALALI